METAWGLWGGDAELNVATEAAAVAGALYGNRTPAAPHTPRSRWNPTILRARRPLRSRTFSSELAALPGPLRDDLRSRPSRLLWWSGTVITAASAVEMVILLTQVVRGRASHFNVSTPLEAGWVSFTFAGGVEQQSWVSQWESESEGWSLRTAAADSPEQLFTWLDESQRITEQVVAEAVTLDALSQSTLDDGDPCSLRWILLHLVQEYGRHLGHADLIREAIDGAVGV